MATNNHYLDGMISSPLGVLGIRMHQHAVSEVCFLPADTVVTTQAPSDAIAAQFAAYFADANHVFDLPVHITGTPFQQRVWNALREIPRGTTLTYGELAKQLRTSPRAIGQACRSNPVPIIVPCHRVTSAKGLGGYAGDTQGKLAEIKEWLLQHECRGNVSPV